MKKICVIIGARPQFIKHAPVELELKKIYNVVSIHTGQHYDKKMSEIFFSQLNISKPTYILNCGGGNHGIQTANMLIKVEEILVEEKPLAVLVYGDTNSTLAGALAASKLNIPIIHIEAGLRSFNRAMPEEINRILTDHVSKLLFAPTNLAIENLRNEGINLGVYHTGDVMFDTVLLAKKIIGQDYKNKNQILVTLHRPYNTDNIDRLTHILTSLNGLESKIIFPVHPRTKNILLANKVDLSLFENIEFVEPISYFDLIKNQLESKCIITDSGGIQKEAYMLKRKCITLRSETEWIETLNNNWNMLLFDNLYELKDAVKKIPGPYIDGVYGNGSAATEIANIINKELSSYN